MTPSQAPITTSSNHHDRSLSPTIIGNYKMGVEIGRGSFANVYKGIDLKGHSVVAIKAVNRSLLKNRKLLENLEIEIKILKDLKHPHIVELLDSQQSNTHFYLIMEYCSLGDLSYFIRKKDELIEKHPLVKNLFNKYPSPVPNSHGLNKILVINYLKQLSSALKFLRSKNLVHRDLKPQNLLLSPPVFDKVKFDEMGFVGLPDLPILRIADFGFARFLPNTSLAETLCGSPLYMAPEILDYKKYTAKADLWSVGAVLFEMSVGKPPFRAENHMELLNKIKKAKDKIHFPSATVESIDPQIKRLICSLLKLDPTERMGFNEFFQDEVVNCDLDLLLQDVNQNISLEPSQVNGNLFISEYISKGGIIDNKNFQNVEEEYNSERSDNLNEIEKNKQQQKSQPIKQINQRDIQPIVSQHRSTSASATPTPAPSGTKSSFKFARNSDPQSSDLVVEKEYVVVEKTAVEVNALADELANAGTGAAAIALPENYYAQSRRRNSRTSSGGSSGGRRPSFDRRVSISISPTNALTKALGLASTRLFGNPQNLGASNIIAPIKSPQSISSTSFNTDIVLNSTNKLIEYNISKSSNERNNDIILQLESLATKAYVIIGFAEIKFSQLIPSPPSTNNFAIEDDGDDLNSNEEEALPAEFVKSIADEAILLFVKVLSLLAKAMNIATEWWHVNNSIPSSRLNEVVQWIREHFNEALEKAEFVKLKLQDAEKKLQNKDANYFKNLMNHSEKIYAEKLIYERALEIAKNTAKLEMTGQDLLGCESAYSTSLWMLEALLDQENSKEKLDSKDTEMVEKYIQNIMARLNGLKKKIELQRS